MKIKNIPLHTSCCLMAKFNVSHLLINDSGRSTIFMNSVHKNCFLLSSYVFFPSYILQRYLQHHDFSSSNSFPFTVSNQICTDIPIPSTCLKSEHFSLNSNPKIVLHQLFNGLLFYLISIYSVSRMGLVNCFCLLCMTTVTWF